MCKGIEGMVGEMVDEVVGIGESIEGVGSFDIVIGVDCVGGNGGVGGFEVGDVVLVDL